MSTTNGELEEIREVQAGKEAESVDFPGESGIMEVGKEETTENNIVLGVILMGFIIGQMKKFIIFKNTI